jgi:uncharacterized membrane protein
VETGEAIAATGEVIAAAIAGPVAAAVTGADPVAAAATGVPDAISERPIG